MVFFQDSNIDAIIVEHSNNQNYIKHVPRHVGMLPMSDKSRNVLNAPQVDPGGVLRQDVDGRLRGSSSAQRISSSMRSESSPKRWAYNVRCFHQVVF